MAIDEEPIEASEDHVEAENETIETGTSKKLSNHMKTFMFIS